MMVNYASKEMFGEVVAGPNGHVMPEAVARMIEKVTGELPEECREMGYQRRTALPAGMDIKADERADISLITSDAIDRDQEVMLPGGADWKGFRQNPVVTWAHHYDELPVGRAMWVRRQDNGWLAKTRYTSKPDGWSGTWFADAVFHMVKEGDLRGKSIGFLPTAMSPPEEKEIAARPELAGVRMIIRKWMALEYAVAPVQSNPDAYVVAVGKAKALDIEIPEIILAEAGLCIPVDIPTIKAVSEEPEPEIPEEPKIISGLDLEKIIDSIDWPAKIAESIDRKRGKV